MNFIILGVLATLFMDFWAFLLRTAFSINGLDYRMLGRWFYYFKDFQFFHEKIFTSEPYKHELILGYLVHYGIGIFFAKVLLIWKGEIWLSDPILLPCLIVGFFTIVAPFFIMQPAFGLGIAGSKTPFMFTIWLKSTSAHLSYGIGLYLAARFMKLLV
ncbi:MAG: DUF2938 domain-containing protein [Bacteriovoracaceae bacterium]|nr:DUF2938 domain-containing protein [Bacteriovoracaceae bacterium]